VLLLFFIIHSLFEHLFNNSIFVSPETAKRFFISHGEPCSRSTLTLQQVEAFLNKLANLTKEDDQYQALAYALPSLLSLSLVAPAACFVSPFLSPTPLSSPPTALSSTRAQPTT